VADNALVNQKLDPDQRVAVLLASLDADVAAMVLQELSPPVMNKAVDVIRRLGLVSGGVRQQVIKESLQEIRTLSSSVYGGDGVAVGLLGKVVGEQRAVSMLDLGNMAGTRFGALALRRPEEVAGLLRAEPVSVIALVLHHLQSQLASEILTALDAALRHRVVVYMATVQMPSAEVIDQVEKQLTARLSPLSGEKTDDQARIDVVVSIIQRSSKEAAEAMLQELEKKSPQLANLVRDQLFVFEDIARLSDAAVRRIMQDLEPGVLSVALRKTTEEVKNRFFSNMSRRAADSMEEEMGFAGKIPFSEVLAKQKVVVKLVQTLAASGDIKIGIQQEEYV
jgi:flagellar motor switch protein FliG